MWIIRLVLYSFRGKWTKGTLYVKSRNCRLLKTQQGCWNICTWCNVKKKVSSCNPGNQICITFRRSSVLTVRPFKLLFIYRARFSFGVLLSQNKLVSYRFNGVWGGGVKTGTIGVWPGDWVAWFQPCCLLCKRWKDGIVHFRGSCLLPCLPENAGFTVFSLCGGRNKLASHIVNLRRKQEWTEVVMGCVYFHAPYTPARRIVLGVHIFILLLSVFPQCTLSASYSRENLELVVFPACGTVEERVLLTIVLPEGQTELDFIRRVSLWIWITIETCHWSK
jgi:hypothetical protein